MAKLLSFYAFSGSYNSPCWLPEPWFLEGGSFLWFLFSPGLFLWEYSVYHLLKFTLAATLGSMHKSQLQIGQRRWGVSTCNIGGAHGPGRGILKWVLHRGSWTDFRLKSWSRGSPPLCSDPELHPCWWPLMFFPVFPPPLPAVTEFPPQYSRFCWREANFSSSIPHRWRSPALTPCSPFPPPERPLLLLVQLHAVLPWGTQQWQNYSSVSSASRLTCFCFYFLHWHPEVFLGKVDFCSLSFMCFCSSQPSVVSPVWLREGSRTFASSCWFRAPYQVVCLLPHAQVGKTPSRPLGIWCCIPQLS